MNTHWENIPEDYDEYAGFVYLVTNKITGKKYIGRKYFFKRVKRILVESDWREYITSSKDVKADIKKFGKNNFDFLCLGVCKDRQELNYLEVKLQFEADVLYAKSENGEFLYYNKNIMSKYFQPSDFGTPEYIQKCENISKAVKALYQRPDYVHPMQGKTHPNKGKKLPQTAAKLNMQGAMWYTNGEVNRVIRKNMEIPDGYVKGLTHRKKRICNANDELRHNYDLNPKLCLVCEKPIPFNRKVNKTCSKECNYKNRKVIATNNYSKSPLNKNLQKEN